MAIRTILKMGDPRLLEPASPVDIELITSTPVQEVIDDLLHTMHSANGAGLAAPQIGVGQQIVVFGFDHNPRYPEAQPIPETILINPVISILSNLEKDDWEGCLSVPGMRAKVPRYIHIRYQGFDRQGKVIDRIVQDFHARVVQHECDHLFGKLFPMRVKDFRHFGFTDVLFPNLQDSSVID